MAPVDLPPIPPSAPLPDDSDRRREERLNQDAQQRFLRRLSERKNDAERDDRAARENPRQSDGSRTQFQPRAPRTDEGDGVRRPETSSAPLEDPRLDESLPGERGIATPDSEDPSPPNDSASSHTRSTLGESDPPPAKTSSGEVTSDPATRTPKRASASGERRAEHTRGSEKSSNRRSEREDSVATSRGDVHDDLRVGDDAVSGIQSANQDGVGLGHGTSDLGRTNVDASIPPHVVRQAVEFAAFSERGGLMEFSLGLTANVLGGAVMTLRALGDRRIAIKVVNGKAGKVIQSADLEDLLARMKARGIEVVEVVVS